MKESIKNSAIQKYVNLTLRDGQQSTLAQEDWVFDPADISKVIAASHKAGFSGAEIAGGQSFQIAITCGYNPFTILSAVSHAMEYGGFRDDFQLQMLFRGANALGFRHYDKDLIEKTLQEFIKCGINKIRFFDALNDIDNLRLPASIKAQQEIILEGALCFTHYPDHPDRYTDEYFLNYTGALIAEGFTAIAIKDMSGQLTPQRISTLVPALLEKLTSSERSIGRNIPLALHIHSTHHQNSLGAMQEALKYGVDTIETTEGVLSGGSAHHSLSSISPEIISDKNAYATLQKSIAKIWSDTPDRKDHHIADDLKQRLCNAGVPGGAMPFVIRDLSQQQSTIRAKYQASKHNQNDTNLEKFETIIDLFIQELKQVCADANFPLLVTPTADICCKQAIANLAFGADPHSGTLAGRYLNNSDQPNPDARFAKLILGHYGELKAYDSEKSGVSNHAPSPEIITFFESHNASHLKSITTTAADSTSGDDLRESQQQAWKLIQKLGAGALSFASFDQLTILYALKPFAPQASIDPIEKAVQSYLARSEKSKIDGRGTLFPGYEFLMQPLLCSLRSICVFDKKITAQDIVHLPLSSFGTTLCGHLYDIYIDLSIWKNVTNLSNHLSLLFSSSHISPQLTQAAKHVSNTLSQLDLRPEKKEKQSIDKSRQTFTTITLAELFTSLSLINSFINDVAKHATNPSLYADRSLTLQDIRNFLTQKSTPSTAEREQQTPWQDRVRQSLVSKRLKLESDLQKRLENWRG